MQNAQNADIQRVINLVELYRTKVGKESDTAQKIKEEQKYRDEVNFDIALQLHEDGVNDPIGIDMFPEIPEEWVNILRVNEQLLGHFYAKVAGKDADKKVLEQLLPELYDTTVFTLEEESYLIAHFREMVNYIIKTPCNDLGYFHGYDDKDRDLIPNEVLFLIQSRVNIPVGSIVYNPFAGFGQIANCYRDSQFYCEESYSAYVQEWNDFCDKCYEKSKEVLGKGRVYEQWAWLKVALYANNPNAKIIENSCAPSTYDAMMAFIPILPKSLPESTFDNYEKQPTAPTLIFKIRNGYKNLRDGGDMILIVPNKALWDAEVEKPFGSFWEELVDDHAIVEIIQLPSVMSKNLYDDCCVIIAKKGYEGQHTIMIDARFATTETSQEKSPIMDLDSIAKMLENGGKDITTGLRKLAQVPSTELNADLLFPQVYVVERPSKEEHPVPLSALCSFESTKVRDVQFDLPEDTPWITISDITPLFTGDLDMSEISKADCPNNPFFVEGRKDYAFDKNGKFIDNIWAQMSKAKGLHVLEYRHCTFLDGNSDAVLYDHSTKHGVRVAVVRAIGRPYVVSKGFLVFCPKNGIDANSLAALFRLPIVSRQLLAYDKYGVGIHLDDILVPTDKRVIDDELSRMKKEESVTKEMKEDFEAGQKKHMVKLEDYQHAMRKDIREISSSVRRMERFINAMESSEEIKSFLHDRLEVIKTHRLYLSKDIERLNEENTYGKAVPFDIDHCLQGFKDYFGSDGYPIVYSNEVAKEAVRTYANKHEEDRLKMSKADWSIVLNHIREKESPAYVDIAEYNFGKVVRNILENARIHGFSSDTSRDDCKIEIVLSLDPERKMYRIDFRNNGDPLPEGLTKDSYGENRKYAGKTGGTGIGGYEVADTVKHYNGDYAISQDGDWVVVSVYLPKSKSYEERV
ncbi:MAG: hypothetical protein J6W75_06410 [Bacteroidaceae bacterium]|nr:hypothetical protein [Bacteroidaceae bacterium]